MVGVPDCGKRHLRAAGAHGDAECGARGVRGRVGVTHHQTLPLQDDGFRFVLSLGRTHHQPGGTEENTERQHRGADRRTFFARFRAV